MTAPRAPDAMEKAWWRQPSVVCLLLAVSLLPLVVSLQSIRDPFGQTEESVNAAIWAVGARHVRDEGWIESKFGAVYTPLFPWSHGVYAHHPPLPVWLSRVWLLFGTREHIPRLFALLLAASTLVLLFNLLRFYVPIELALVAIAATATTGYMARYGRLFTTLTIATPLFVVGLNAVLRRIHFGRPWRFSLFLVVPLLVASSWDGVAGAGALCTVLVVHEGMNAVRLRTPTRPLARALALAIVGLASIGALGWYFVNASGSLAELLRQAGVRSGGMGLGFVEWVGGQFRFLHEGFGLLGVVILISVPLVLLLHAPRAPLLGAVVLSSVPGVAMVGLMREGAAEHAFWGYNLILPFAFTVAQALRWAEKRGWALGALTGLLLLQAAANLANAGAMLEEERNLNALGALIRSYYPSHPVERVAVYGAYDFHPYIAWYLRLPHDVAFSQQDLDERLKRGVWRRDTPVLVDTLHLGHRPCRVLATAANGRWVIADAEDIGLSCGPPK